MSLILDALKKSEAERQRGKVPNLLSSSPTATGNYSAHRKSTLPWIILSAFLLAMLVLGYLMMKSNDVDAPDGSTSPLDSAPMNMEATAPTASNAAPTTPKASPAPIATPAPPVGQLLQTKPPSPFDNQASVEPAKPEAEVTEPTPETRIAGMAEMPVDQRQQLPALKLSMHVYSSDSGKRFAIIDGQRVNEGSVIGAAVVEEIRPDGVVLSMQGQSYLLPRP